jgi:hypothetical protein
VDKYFANPDLYYFKQVKLDKLPYSPVTWLDHDSNILGVQNKPK